MWYGIVKFEVLITVFLFLDQWNSEDGHSNSTETSVTIYTSARRHVPQYLNLQRTNSLEAWMSDVRLPDITMRRAVYIFVHRAHAYCAVCLSEIFLYFLVWLFVPTYCRCAAFCCTWSVNDTHTQARTHTYTHTRTHSVGFLWTRDRPVAESFAWQNTTFKKDRQPCPQRDSNPQSKQASGGRHRRLTTRGNRDLLH